MRVMEGLARGAVHRFALAAALIICAAFAAAGCGSDDNGGGGGASTSGGGGGSKTANIAFVYPTTETNFAQEMALGAKGAADDVPGVHLTESAPANVDGPKQVQLFQAAAHTSKDGVSFMTLAPPLFLRPILTASQDGVPLVAVDVPPPKGAENAVKLLVGNNNVEIGQQLGKAILPKIPKGATGEVLIGTDTPGLPVLEQRNQGFKDVVGKARPGVKFLTFDAKQSPTDNFNTWSAQVRAHPDALAYVGPGSQAAVSLSRIEAKTGQKLVVGACDLDPVALNGVKKGYVTALISPEHWVKGYIAVHLLADQALNGKDLPEGAWNTGALTVDSKNIDEIIKRQQSPAARKAYFKDVVAGQLANPDKYLGPAPTGG